jgi:hypothetical protein
MHIRDKFHSSICCPYTSQRSIARTTLIGSARVYPHILPALNAKHIVAIATPTGILPSIISMRIVPPIRIGAI